jgi:hypothetical protein
MLKLRERERPDSRERCSSCGGKTVKKKWKKKMKMKPNVEGFRPWVSSKVKSIVFLYIVVTPIDFRARESYKLV